VKKLGLQSCWAEAVRLLAELQRLTQLDIVAFGAGIGACSRARGGVAWPWALWLFEEAKALFPPSPELLGAVISALGKAARWQEALNLFMHEGQVPRNAVMWSALVSSGPAVLAGPLIQEAASQAIRLDTISYNAAISCCDKGSRWQSSVELWEDLRKVGLWPQVRTLNCCIAAFRNWEASLRVLGSLRVLQLQQDEVTRNVILGACGSRWSSVLAALEGASSLNIALASCGRAGQWQEESKCHTPRGRPRHTQLPHSQVLRWPPDDDLTESVPVTIFLRSCPKAAMLLLDAGDPDEVFEAMTKKSGLSSPVR
ncbi:unnamed protein product, partial [Effrenium voratum]